MLCDFAFSFTVMDFCDSQLQIPKLNRIET